FYAVRRGHEPGVYNDWPSAQKQIAGFQKARHKSFQTRYEAEEFVRALSPDVTAGEPAAKKRKGSENATLIELPAGLGPLPPDAEDGFDHTITLDPQTGLPRKKTDAELRSLRAVSREGPASSKVLQIWTDGACRANGTANARAGVGVFFGPNDNRNLAEKLPGERQTNQRAELTAIKRALDICPMNQSCFIWSDSKYAIQCVTVWFQAWERNNWKSSKGKAVDNKDIIEEILSRIRDREKCKAKTQFEWVKGHGGSEENERADKLAVKG
ncbi:ribonuclease H-like protein, partial [Microthyrium microscopicum]